MDRIQVFPGAVPLETDLLNTNRNTMVALGKLAGAVLGTANYVRGLTAGPSNPAALNVVVQPGELYALQNLDGTAYSSLAADTAHQIVKQGILLDAVTLSTPAPATAGQSINYLIQAAFSEVDDTPVVLPYYNASNPTQAYSGPNNTGATNNTRRADKILLSAKAGVAATTGSQTTPAPDAGYIGLYAVTVANGQTTVTASNIVQVAGAPIISNLLQMLQSASAITAADTGTANAYALSLTPGPAALTPMMLVQIDNILNSNTGAATLNVNGLGALPIQGPAGAALQGGELVAGYGAVLRLNRTGSAWTLLQTTGGPLPVANATGTRQAVARGQVLTVSPQQVGLGVSAPAASTTYSVSASFTAPCNGYVMGFGSLAIAGTLASGAIVSYAVLINGVQGSGDANPWPLNTEFATASVSSGTAVTVTFQISTNATAPGVGMALHVASLFVPNP